MNVLIILGHSHTGSLCGALADAFFGSAAVAEAEDVEVQGQDIPEVVILEKALDGVEGAIAGAKQANIRRAKTAGCNNCQIRKWESTGRSWRQQIVFNASIISNHTSAFTPDGSHFATSVCAGALQRWSWIQDYD